VRNCSQGHSCNSQSSHARMWGTVHKVTAVTANLATLGREELLDRLSTCVNVTTTVDPTAGSRVTPNLATLGREELLDQLSTCVNVTTTVGPTARSRVTVHLHRTPLLTHWLVCYVYIRCFSAWCVSRGPATTIHQLTFTDNVFEGR